MKSKMKKTAAVVLLFSMAAGTGYSQPGMEQVSAASGPRLSKKKVVIKEKKSAMITLKNKAGAKKIKWSITNKRVATIKAKSGSVTVKGKKAGNTTGHSGSIQAENS